MSAHRANRTEAAAGAGGHVCATMLVCANDVQAQKGVPKNQKQFYNLLTTIFSFSVIVRSSACYNIIMAQMAENKFTNFPNVKSVTNLFIFTYRHTVYGSIFYAPV